MREKAWWAQVRDIAPEWRAQAEGLHGCRPGEVPRCVIKMGIRGPGGLQPVNVDYYDLAMAIGQLWRIDEKLLLRPVVNLWLTGLTLEAISESLARPVHAKTVGRRLNIAFRWVCSAEGGGFVEPVSQMSTAVLLDTVSMAGAQ